VELRVKRGSARKEKKLTNRNAFVSGLGAGTARAVWCCSIVFRRAFVPGLGAGTARAVWCCSIVFRRAFVPGLGAGTARAVWCCSIVFRRAFVPGLGAGTARAVWCCSIVFRRAFVPGLGDGAARAVRCCSIVFPRSAAAEECGCSVVFQEKLVLWLAMSVSVSASFWDERRTRLDGGDAVAENSTGRGGEANNSIG